MTPFEKIWLLAFIVVTTHDGQADSPVFLLITLLASLFVLAGRGEPVEEETAEKCPFCNFPLPQSRGKHQCSNESYSFLYEVREREGN